MALFKCKMCGGTLEINNNETVATCEYCGTKQTLPKLDDDRRANLYDRANHFRRNNEFDKAMGIYEQILNEDNTDAEAYWSLVLCRYGIEYVEDPATHKRIPTVNRAQFTSIFDDDNYKSALQYADGIQRSIYEAESKAINEIQKGILAISQKEEPFDVFICYKETDNNGRRTPDSVLANDLYHQLTQEGFKVFFARITLEDKLGAAYEPYIFAALNSAKVMVALGTKPEYFKAVWVRNEWSRYLALIKQGQKKMLIPAYKDMDPYDLPEEFSHLQAQDMSKLGFMQDLIRGIKKIAEADTPKVAVVKETVHTAEATNTAPLLKRAFMFLEDGDWTSANDYCEKVLDIDPECAMAYLGKLMAELQVKEQELLKNKALPFDGSNYYQKALRFADENLKTELVGYIDYINDRNENARLDGIYKTAKNFMFNATTEIEYKKAAEIFESVSQYLDSADLAQECYDNAEICRKDFIFEKGKTKMCGLVAHDYESAIKAFESIPGWKDADEMILICKRKIEEINAKAEEERLEKKRKAEIERIEAEKRKKQIKKITIVGISIVSVIVAFVIILNMVIIPNSKYNDAITLMQAGKYSEAITAFEALDGYKDSADKIAECNTAIIDSKYNEAIALMKEGKYIEAKNALLALEGYKDSFTKIDECKDKIFGDKYKEAIALMEEGKYTEARSAFYLLEGYKDSIQKMRECNTAAMDGQYNDALALIETGNIVEAYEMLIELDGYKDSANKAESIYKIYKLKTAKVGDYVLFGEYEQDNNRANGKEDVEWLVLEVKDGKVLVISQYALDCKEYNTSRTDVTWESCTLRKWLNNDFVSSAFSVDEKAMIPTVNVSADKNPQYSTNPGNATQDQVFLLSITEANKYFISESARQCKSTDYADANGAYVSYEGNCMWWLRSPGKDLSYAANVDRYDGDIDEDGRYVTYSICAVRPALWIDLNS